MIKLDDVFVIAIGLADQYPGAAAEPRRTRRGRACRLFVSWGWGHFHYKHLASVLGIQPDSIYHYRNGSLDPDETQLLERLRETISPNAVSWNHKGAES